VIVAVNSLTFTLVTGVYLVILVVLGYLGYKRTKGADDFMLAGRKVHSLAPRPSSASAASLHSSAWA
jgi:Na+/proline symporter